MNRPTHFEIHAGDPERAIKFYTAVFGWHFQKWDGPMPYWLITTGTDGPGINGGMVPRQGPAPADGQAVNAYPTSIKVASCDATVAAITANGGTIALPRMPIPAMGWLAYGKDTEGNIFGVMQDDPTAK
jgi:predicted enzyme related to lactoylglutathione lyase